MTGRPQSWPLWPAYLATFTFTLGQWASGVAIPLHVQSLGGSLTEAGTIAAIRFGLGAIFSLPFGAVADAWGTRRTVTVAVIGFLSLKSADAADAKNTAASATSELLI